MMKLFLYTRVFEHEGVKRLSCSIGVRRGEIECLAVMALPTYPVEAEAFDAAMGLLSIMVSTRQLLENLGHEVEIEDVLGSTLTIADAIREEFKK